MGVAKNGEGSGRTPHTYILLALYFISYILLIKKKNPLGTRGNQRGGKEGGRERGRRKRGDAGRQKYRLGRRKEGEQGRKDMQRGRKRKAK